MLEIDLIIEIEVFLQLRCRSWFGCRFGGRFSGRLRTSRHPRVFLGRDPYPQGTDQAAAKVRLGRKDRDDLSSPVGGIVTIRSANGAIVGTVERQPFFAVAEPHHQLLRLIGALADQLFRDAFDL
jgi:hypothetical protein